MPLILAGQPTKLIDDADKVEAYWSQVRRNELFFYPGCNRNTGRFAQQPRGIMVHWTGAENPPETMARTLSTRELSIHFVIDSGIGEGRRRIVQMADPVTTRCAHGGIANPGFIGIEVVNRGFARPEDVRGSDLRERSSIDYEVARATFTDRLAGRALHFASYEPRVFHDLVWLLETLCGLMEIPRIIPFERVFERDLEALRADPSSRMLAEVDPVKDAEGYLCLPRFDRDTRRLGRAHTFKGIIGHFHTHADKCDPGTQPFYALWREGFNPAGERTYQEPLAW